MAHVRTACRTERIRGGPGSITVAGQSAGAFSVGALLAVPSATGLFHLRGDRRPRPAAV
ncbi:carboxylesterase family protein [Streptomyces sp. SID13726]|nr:carboxylesterase family protein [Streptomyces sp. SID13726]